MHMQNNYCFCIHFTGLRIFLKNTPHACHPTRIEKKKIKFSGSDLLYGIPVFDVFKSVCQTGKNTKLENSLNI